MRKNKKLIIIAVVIGIVLVGSLAGAAFAQTTSTDNSKTLLGRVATILGIEQQTVEDAFAQAQKDMQSEALDNYLKKLVEDGKLTQEQADQYKTWLESKPDVPIGPGFKMPGRGFGGFRCGPGFDRLPPPPSTTAQ